MSRIGIVLLYLCSRKSRKSKNRMKGMVELCYEMPQWETYLETSEVAFSEVQMMQLKNELHDFLSDAILELVEENRLYLMKKLHDFLENEEIFAGSNKIFRKMPPMPEDIVFDTDMTAFLEEEMLLEAREHPLIFLDFDGVLNTENHFAKMTVEGVPTRDYYGPKFDPKAVANLLKIIEATDAWIIVSSSWRYMGLKELQRMWTDRHLPGWIAGITPLHTDDEKLLETDLRQLDEVTPEMFSSSRGNEIKAYFNEMPGNSSDAQRYVILDDLNEVLPEQESHFIRINPIVGITEEDVERAIEIINQ